MRQRFGQCFNRTCVAVLVQNPCSGGQAVDIVTYRTGGDYPIRVAGGSHAPDGESIALVHIRHHGDVPHQPRQGRRVDGLLQRVVAHRLPQQLLADEHPHGDAHIVAVGFGDFPLVIADFFEIGDVYHWNLRGGRIGG